MRILITNVYSFKNKGDAAIIISLIREIKRVFDEPRILIQATDSAHDTDKYGEPVTSSLMWLLFSSVRKQPMPKRLWVAVCGLAGLCLFLLCAAYLHKKPYFLLASNLRSFVKENETADMVLACGGGYLRSASSGPQDTLLLFGVCLNNLIVPASLGKKVYLYSQSIGPVHGWFQRILLRWALNRAQLIEPREDISVRFLQQLGVKAPIYMTADPALLLGGTGKLPKTIHLQPRRMHVGVTVREWFYGDSAQLEHYIRSIAQTIDYLVTEHNAQVFYIPQVIAEDFGDDDRLIARKVFKQVKHPQDFTVIESDLHPFEIIGLCGKMDIFVGTRMHSNIFALINHVPVVAIEYEHKTRGIMRGLGLENLTVDIQDVTSELLRAKVDQLIQNREKYVNAIRKNLPKQIMLSRSAIEAIKTSYEHDR